MVLGPHSLVRVRPPSPRRSETVGTVSTRHGGGPRTGRVPKLLVEGYIDRNSGDLDTEMRGKGVAWRQPPSQHDQWWWAQAPPASVLRLQFSYGSSRRRAANEAEPERRL
jgi:hypothetical protein